LSDLNLKWAIGPAVLFVARQSHHGCGQDAYGTVRVIGSGVFEWREAEIRVEACQNDKHWPGARLVLENYA
jgi:hypothetical protein